MAKDQQKANSDALPQDGEIKVRLLVDSDLGKCNDVVLIDARLAETMVGMVDTDPAAVEYAETIAKE